MRRLGNHLTTESHVSAADDQADQESGSESAEHAFGGILTDVIFCGDVEFLGFHPGVLPLFGGGFLEVLGLVRGHALKAVAFSVAAALNWLARSVAVSRNCWAVSTARSLKRGGFFLGRVDEFAGLFASGDAEVVGGLGDGWGLGESGFRIQTVSG